MTKVSKVYFGLSRVSSALPWGLVGERRRRGRRDDGRICRHVDVSTCRRVVLRMVGSHLPLVEAGVDGDRDPDFAGEAHGEGVLELPAEPALELDAREVVGHRDDRGVLVEGDRLAGAQPGPLVGLQLVDDLAPRLVEVRHHLLHGSRRLSAGLRPTLCPPPPRGAVSTSLSTGCEPDSMAVERVGPGCSQNSARAASAQVSEPSRGCVSGITGGGRASRSGDPGELRWPEPNPRRRAAASRHPQAWTSPSGGSGGACPPGGAPEASRV